MDEPTAKSPPIMPSAATPSPLAEASPTSLDELFSRPPRDMIREDHLTGSRNIESIVRELRRQRERWALDEAAGKVRATAARPKKATLTLKDLGIDGEL